MSDEPDHHGRALFIQSHSFGDLVMTMSFLKGVESLEQTVLALPAILSERNQDILGFPVRGYASCEDLLRLVDEFKPTLVFLVSAYGVFDDEHLPRRDLPGFLRQMQLRGCRLVTTDPVLGLSQQFAPRKVDLPLHKLTWMQRFVVHRKLKKMFRGFTRSERLLRHVPHLYPMPTNVLPTSGNRRLSFRPLETGSAENFDEVVSGSDKRWLFLIGASDVICQNLLYGAGFVGMLTEKLAEANEAGRRPVLIAPPRLIEAVKSQKTESDAEFFAYCTYTEFVGHLQRAEYVFYWNVFSCSILLRILESKPVFFFDTGHIARIMQPCHEVGIQAYYGGVRPRLLDVRKKLDGEALARLAGEQQDEARKIQDYLKQSPAPAAVLKQLLRD